MPAPGGALSAIPRERRSRGSRLRAASWIADLVGLVMMVVAVPAGQPYALVTGIVMSVGCVGLGALALGFTSRAGRAAVVASTAIGLLPLAIAAFA